MPVLASHSTANTGFSSGFSLPPSSPLPDPLPLPDPEPQNTDFIRCIHNRERFALNEENGHRSSTLVNLGACAVRLNRTLHFDPVKQLFIGDDAANRLIDQPMRSPWKI